MKCLICGGETKLAPIHEVWTEADYRFWRCLECGSETSDRQYTPADYNCDNRDDYFLEQLGSWPNVLEQLNTNVHLFAKNSDGVSGKTFLDVGYCDGAMLARMSAIGCDVTGFDVFPHKAQKIAARAGISQSQLFHGDSLVVIQDTFDMINCREVIEHVAEPHLLMRQMVARLNPNGLLQVQTPLPSGNDSRIPYQIQHLCLISHPMLRAMGLAHGLSIVETLLWPLGQAIVFRGK